MNLNEYENQINEIKASELTGSEKRCALEMTADEIDGALWQAWTKERARELSAQARRAANEYPDGGLEALDGLAVKGLLIARG